jgi:hypothetical protein
LDFKGAARLQDGDIKRIWSEALSGFANTGGGVLVWGVDARKTGDSGIDCACGFSLVGDPASLVSRLKQLHSQATDPPVAGVDFWFGSDGPESDAGFVVCHVPESRFKPHRAELAGRNYYIRAGDSFHVPSVSLLRNLFFPEYHAHLWPEIKACFDGETVWLEGFVHNSGIATARNVVVFVTHNAQVPWKLEPALNWNPIGTPHHEHRKGSGLTSVHLPIHPGTSSACFRLTRPIRTEEFRRINTIDMELFMYCENNQPMVSRVSFTLNELEDKVSKQGVSEIMEVERRGF